MLPVDPPPDNGLRVARVNALQRSTIAQLWRERDILDARIAAYIASAVHGAGYPEAEYVNLTDDGVLVRVPVTEGGADG